MSRHPKFDIAVKRTDLLGESIIWDSEGRQLVWVDIPRGMVFRKLLASDVIRSVSLGEAVGSVGLMADGGLVLGLASGFAALDGAGRLTRFARVEEHLPSTRLNDGRVDRQGRFVCGGVDEEPPVQRPISKVYRLDSDGTASPIIDDIACANSICFSPEGDLMYVTDMPTRQILRYEYDADEGRPHTPTVFADFADQPGLPDGSTIDEAGCLWNAQWGGSRVVRFTPKGQIDRIVELPVSIPTCVAFGGDDLSTLFVTSARIGLSEEQLARQPHSGSIFALDLGVKGLVEPLYRRR